MKSLITKTIVVASFTILTQGALAQWDSPSHNTATCVATPAEMMQNPAVSAWAGGLQDKDGRVGLDAFVGTWKFNMVIAKATISFKYDAKGFYVQNEDDVSARVSLCMDKPGSKWLRVAAHQPSCPENRNFYIQAAGLGTIVLTAYTTQRAPGGKVKFKKTSSRPLPEGSPKQSLPCRM